MLKRLAAVAVVMGLFVVAAGCVAPQGAIFAPVCNTKSAVAVGDPSAGTGKVGEAKAEGIIFMGTGDASIKAAMEDGNITRIHHVDSEEMNVLWVYARKVIKVYGE